MEVRLTIQNGPQKGSSVLLRSGQLVRFGRTNWADCAFPYDSALADIHFSLETSARGVILIDLSRGRGTQVDGEPVKQRQLLSNQKIQAGSLEFLVEFEAAPASIFGTLPGQDPSQPPPVPEARTICAHATLSPGAKSLLEDGIKVTEFLLKLVDKKLWADAWSVLVALMGKSRLVGWSAREFTLLRGESLSTTEQELLSATTAWGADPTAENLSPVRSRVESDEQSTAAAWVALAAVWSGESLTAPGTPVIAPAPGLTAKALNAAWNFLAAEINPDQREPILGDAINRAIQAATAPLG